MTLGDGRAIVTGASSGIGMAFPPSGKEPGAGSSTFPGS